MIHILRRYRSSDRQAVWDLHNLALSLTGAHGGNGPMDDDLARIEEVYLQDGEFIVGTIEEKIVAMGAIKRISNERAELKRIRVHPDHQGQGYGRQVMEWLEQRARNMGFKVVHLDTTDRQVAAHALYTRRGYVEVQRRPWRDVTLIFYEKEL